MIRAFYVLLYVAAALAFVGWRSRRASVKSLSYAGMGGCLAGAWAISLLVAPWWSS